MSRRSGLQFRTVTPHQPFLFLATRHEDVAADDEYAAMLRFCGLTESSLHRVRVERAPLGEVDLERWSGIIVGGSPFNISDPADTKSATQVRVEAELAGLLDRAIVADFPFFGACYGIGSLTVQQGGLVDRTFGEPVGAVTVSLTAAGLADPVFGGLPQRFEAFVGHKEAVTVVPPSAVVLASSPACPVQAMRVGRNVYASQFHPELDADGLAVRVDAYRDQGYFPPAEAEAVKARARAATVTHAGDVLRRFVEHAASLHTAAVARGEA